MLYTAVEVNKDDGVEERKEGKKVDDRDFLAYLGALKGVARAKGPHGL